MKNILIILGVVGMLLTSCKDEALAPIITFDQAGKGAYVKLLSETPRELDLANLSTAAYSYSAEFVDIDQGNLVADYTINATFVDNSPSNGDNSGGPIAVKTVSSSSFTSSDRGFKAVDVSITLAELLSTFGLQADDLKANDQFRMTGAITLTDGQVFTAANSSAAVNGSAFGGHFNYTLTATCPLPDNIFVGNYTLNYVDAAFPFGAPTFGGGGDGRTVTLRTVPGSTTQRAFSYTYLEAGGFGNGDVDFRMAFICDAVEGSGTADAGLNCGGDGISLSPGTVNLPVDITDDAVIDIQFTEFGPSDGGCGVAPIQQIIQLTKQ